MIAENVISVQPPCAVVQRHDSLGNEIAFAIRVAQAVCTLRLRRGLAAKNKADGKWSVVFIETKLTLRLFCSESFASCCNEL